MAELGVSPDAETDALYDRILAGEIDVIAEFDYFKIKTFGHSGYSFD